MTKKMWKYIAKVGMLLVVIGFLMPVSCNLDGFQIAQSMSEGGSGFMAFLMYMLFVLALASVVMVIFIIMNKKTNKIIDWALFGADVLCGLIPFIKFADQAATKNQGFYFIIIGWIVTLVALLVPEINKSLKD
jgi:hypothetical protein